MGQDVFDTCADRQLCMVAFLPHILDSTAAGRNGYIATLLGIAERYKQRPFGYVGGIYSQGVGWWCMLDKN